MAALLGYATSLFRRGKADGVPGRLKSVTIPLYFRQPSGLALFAPAIIGSYPERFLESRADS
ncbi:hypothetical protein C8R44DRAFT_782531 [Mycena epipterygia]|nr:hypothetical protein C8R44DRAFT_782531 [Mycena epipterygia]